MPSLEPLLAAPDDDAPRLVYADAVGGARGELIVVQCALARGGLARDRELALRRRERELLAQHGAQWAGLAGLARRWRFHRGFVDEVTVDARACPGFGGGLIAAAPLLRRLRLERLVSNVDEGDPTPLQLLQPVLEHEAFANVDFLDLGAPLSEWLHDGELSQYTRGQWVSDDAVALLARTGTLRRLRGVRVERLGPKGLAVLLGHPDAAGLDSIEAWGSFTAAETTRLLQQPLTARPSRLHVVDDDVVAPFEEALSALVAHPLTSRVQDLRVGRLEQEPLAQLLASPLAAQLRRLGAGLTLTRESLAAVADTHALERLEVLAISGAMAGSLSLVERRGPVDYAPLFGPTRLHALRELFINSAWVTDDIARAVVQAPLVKQLVLLDLTNNPWMFGEEGPAWREALDTELRLDPPRPRPATPPLRLTPPNPPPSRVPPRTR